MSLAFVVVMLCSYVFLDEALTVQKIFGLALIILGAGSGLKVIYKHLL